MRIETLLKWLKDTPKDVAEQRCRQYGTSRGYLLQVAYGNKKAQKIGPAIEKITLGACKRQDLRPADFDVYWPELAKAETV